MLTENTMRDPHVIHSQFSCRIYQPQRVVFKKGKGVWLHDTKGKRYLDAFACHSTLNQGHRHPTIVAAAKQQLDKITLTSRAYLNQALPLFLERLCGIASMEQAIPMNSGMEAIETALKVARKWGYEIKGVPRGDAEIIVMDKSFHGRSITTISASTMANHRSGFEPFTPGFVVVPFADVEEVKKAINKNTVAVLLEPIQSVNRLYRPPDGYLAELRKITRLENVLLILDEIQTGLGRTGKLFAWEWEDAKPDILCLGKALGGGIYPVSAVLSSREILSVLGPGTHGSTLAGNPLASAIGLASLKVVEEERLASNAWKMGNHICEELRAFSHPDIRRIKGKGLLIGIQLAVSSESYVRRLIEHEIVSYSIGDHTLRLTPPLIINERQVDFLLGKLHQVFDRNRVGGFSNQGAESSQQCTIAQQFARRSSP
jgi:ornithine--oxo-acid transaminase